MTDILEQAADTRRNAVYRAGKASVELQLTEEIFARMRADVLEKWASTSAEHTATREKMFFEVKAIDDVRRALAAAVQGGALEQHFSSLTSPAQADR